jgi:hypothetical protein
MVADDDEVRLEHAVEMYRHLPNVELTIIPGTSHGLLLEKPDLCNLLITEFLTLDMIACRVFASVLPDPHPDLRVVGVAGAIIGVEGCRATGAAS